MLCQQCKCKNSCRNRYEREYVGRPNSIGVHQFLIPIFLALSLQMCYPEVEQKSFEFLKPFLLNLIPGHRHRPIYSYLLKNTITSLLWHLWNYPHNCVFEGLHFTSIDDTLTLIMGGDSSGDQVGDIIRKCATMHLGSEALKNTASPDSIQPQRVRRGKCISQPRFMVT